MQKTDQRTTKSSSGKQNKEGGQRRSKEVNLESEGHPRSHDGGQIESGGNKIGGKHEENREHDVMLPVFFELEA